MINLPTQLLISTSRNTIESGKEMAVLKPTANKFGNYELKGEKVNWKLAPEYQSPAKLQVNDDGTCTVIPTNDNDDTRQVIVITYGLSQMFYCKNFLLMNLW